MDSGRGKSHIRDSWMGLEQDSAGWGGWGGITWGEMPDIDEEGIEAANHLVMYAPMQQPCMTYTCTPEPKVKLKKIYIYVY